MAREIAARAAADVAADAAGAAAGGAANGAADGAADEAAGEPEDEPEDESVDEAVDEPAHETADERAGEPTDELADEPANDSADEATDELAGGLAGQAADHELDLNPSASNRGDKSMGSKRKSDEEMGSRGSKRPRTSHQSRQASSDDDVGNSANSQEPRPEAGEPRSSDGAQRGVVRSLHLSQLLRYAQDQEAQRNHQNHLAEFAPETSSEARYPRLPADVAPRPADKDAEIEITKALGYMEESSAPEEWNFVKCLGSGSFGRACLWVKRNSTHTIIDRAVIKENYLERVDWADDSNWGNDQVPWEAYVHERLSRLDRGRRSIVHFRNHRLVTERAMFRLYMEFGSGGTLNDLIERHANLNDANMKAADGRRLEYHIPARFIWSAFEAMARAACLMKNGSVINSSPAEWERLVHRDIKPANILIMHAPRPPADAWWPSLPLVKLGDFGMMVREDNKGFDNPSVVMNLGTELYCAPEQFSNHLQRENLLKYKLTPAADVFAIGKVVLCMMQLRNDTEKRKPSVQLDYKPYEFPEELGRRYGPELVKLVKRCMKPEPDKRISPERLLSKIQGYVESVEDDEGTPTPLKFQLPRPEDYLCEKKDLYELLSR
ncbi:hypothetical protein KC333_g7842 [Hortaea werneckii]|nr:hypothetical protein KC333_g7842 [Hortaea werneckii]KAI7309248.1 hypothetical protein KC326_g7112 [Hortaea werneckii]